MSIATSIPSAPVVACVALGSNLGDRHANIRAAIAALQAHPAIEVLTVSSLHETEPIGLAGQAKYVNAAATMRTMLSPRDLLTECLRIEVANNRIRTPESRWGPRTLDIDVLLYGDLVIDDEGPPRLCIPHPRMTERRFVMEPLTEIAGNLIHPVLKMPISAIGARLRDAEYQPRPSCL